MSDNGKMHIKPILNIPYKQTAKLTINPTIKPTAKMITKPVIKIKPVVHQSHMSLTERLKQVKVPTHQVIEQLKRTHLSGTKVKLKPRNGGTWTEARFRTFIKSTLRSATGKWGPKNRCKSNARVSRGKYLCAECKQIGPTTLPAPPGKKRRINNAIVDHIDPIIDPAVGFRTWDEVINKMFCELDNLQLLCHKCHTIKTAEERDIATMRRRSERLKR